MEKRDVEAKLTPAARQMLDELVDDYRAQLLLGAQQSAAQLAGELREVSVHDLLRSYGRISGRGQRSPTARSDRIISAYALAAVLVGVVGLLAYAFQRLLSGGDIEAQLPLLIGLTGLSLAAIAFSYSMLRYRRYLSGEGFVPASDALPLADREAGYIAGWRDIEVLLRSVAVARLGESMARASISGLVEGLQREGVLGEADVKALRDLLLIRNRILHERGRVSASELDHALRVLVRLRARFGVPDVAWRRE